jgi:predicted membrane channel-forming protein YqfA (hemolysin III family)
VSAASAAAIGAGAAQGDARRIGVLFMVGSACFAVASLPAASSLSDEAVGVVYFVGSFFFTTAAFEQLRVARGEGNAVWAAGIQFVGTLSFNVTTFFGMYDHLSAQRSDLLVWSPDAFGSVCFLVSSVLAELAVLHAVLLVRRSATLNLVGSIAFGVSAIAAFVIPDSDDLLNASLATSMTLVGALCFLWGARILVRPPPWLLPSTRRAATQPA